MARQGAKLLLDERRLKLLFPAMQVAVQAKYIAYALGVAKPDTIKQWIKAGEVLQDQFEQELEPLNDIAPFEYESIFESRKLEFDAEFRKLYDLQPEDKIADRLKLEYNNFLTTEKKKFIEKNVERKEDEILKKIKLSDDEDLDKEFKLYIRFARIYNRGVCTTEMGYITNINRHASTSKNVALSMKMLEKMNKEDFADTQTVNHTGTLEVQSKSILGIALNWEKQQRQALEAKENVNLIDITPQALIETTKKDEV